MGAIGRGPRRPHHSPGHSLALLSGRAPQGGPGHRRDRVLGRVGARAHVWGPGRGKGGPHLLAFGSGVPSVTLSTNNSQVGRPARSLTTSSPAPRSPWGPDLLGRQGSPET